MKYLIPILIIVLSGCGGIPSDYYHDMKNYCYDRYSPSLYKKCMSSLETRYWKNKEIDDYVAKKGWM